MRPQRANVFILRDAKERPITAIINRKMYRLEELDDEGMAEAYNGGDALPIVDNLQTHEN